MAVVKVAGERRMPIGEERRPYTHGEILYYPLLERRGKDEEAL
jgi:hypothetical protein